MATVRSPNRARSLRRLQQSRESLADTCRVLLPLSALLLSLFLNWVVDDEQAAQKSWEEEPANATAIGAYMPLKEGNHRYIQTGRAPGEQLAAVQKIPNARGLWHLRRPDGRMAAVNTSKRGEITPEPLPGVAYTPQPMLDEATKQEAKAASMRLIQAGVNRPTLVAWRANRNTTLMGRIIGFVGMAASLPAVATATWNWVGSSYLNMFLSLWVIYASYYLAVLAVELPVYKRCSASISAAMAGIQGFTKQRYDEMHATAETFEEWAAYVRQEWDLDVEGYQLSLIFMGVLIFAIILYLFRAELALVLKPIINLILQREDDDEETDVDDDGAVMQQMSSQSPDAPAFSPRTDQIGQLAAKVETLTALVGNLANKISTGGQQSSKESVIAEGSPIGDLAAMKKKVDLLERVVAEDAGGERPIQPRKNQRRNLDGPPGLLGPLPEQEEAARKAWEPAPEQERPVPVAVSPFSLRGNPSQGEQAVLGAVNDAGAPAEQFSADQVSEAYLQPLLALCVNVHSMMMSEIRRFRPIGEKLWPLPFGFRVRITASYLAHVYKNGTATQYATQWLKDHGLEDCLSAQIFLEYMRGFDRLLLIDKVPGWINWVETEYRCRKCWGLELAFHRVTKKEHWLRPKNNANWVSLVDWGQADLVDPGRAEADTYRNRELEDEVRESATRESSLLLAKSKMAELAKKAADPLNPTLGT